MKKILGLLFLYLLTSASSFPTSPRELSVMTFNVRTDSMRDGDNAWSNRRPLALALLAERSPDVIGFQEVSPFQRPDLQLGMPDYPSNGIGREQGGRGEQCPVFYRNNQRPLASGTFWLSPTPDVPGIGWDAVMPRICTWVRFPGVTVFNSHLDYQGSESRKQSLRLIRERAKGPFVLMGDFNDGQDAAALEPVEGMIDAYRSAHPGEGEDPTYHGYLGDSYGGQRIDFILVSPEIQVLSADIVRSPGPVYPSDHYPVVARLRLP